MKRLLAVSSLLAFAVLCFIGCEENNNHGSGNESVLGDPSLKNTVYGRVVDENKRAVDGVKIIATPMRCTLERQNFSLTVRSGKDGRYVINNAVAGEEYSLELYKGGFYHRTDSVLSGAAKEKVTVLKKARSHRLTGGVLQAGTGKPATGASVRVIGERGYDRTVVSDKKGNFVFEDFPENIGQGVIYAGKDGKLSGYRLIRKTASSVSLTLDQPGKISGTITSKKSGKPIAGCIVKARPRFMSGFAVETKTNQNGGYRFDNLPHGGYIVWPRNEQWFQPPTRGHYMELRDIGVSPSGASTYNVEMMEKATVIGKVIAPDGTPVAGAMVGVNSAIEPLIKTVRDVCRTDENGVFKLRTGELEVIDTHPGAMITAIADGMGVGQVVLKDLKEGEVRDGRDDELAIKLSGVMSVSGYVKDPSGKGIPGVVAIGYANRPPYCKTDESGYYQLDNIVLPLKPEERIKIFFTAPRPHDGDLNILYPLDKRKPAVMPDRKTQYYLNNSGQVAAVHGSDVKLDVTLTPTGKVYFSGKVTNELGLPIAKANVFLFGGNAPADKWKREVHLEMGSSKFYEPDKSYAAICRTVTDDKGRFEFCAARESKKHRGMANLISTLDPTLFSMAMVTLDGKSKVVHDIFVPVEQEQKNVDISLSSIRLNK